MGTTERRQREANLRRRSILKAARKVFWKHGYDNATMPQIAKVAELAPGTLYLYFSSKDALYIELLGEGYSLLLKELEKQAELNGKAQDAASGLIDVFFDFARKFPKYFDIMFFVIQRETTRSWEKNFPAEQIERVNSMREACKQVAAKILKQINFGTADKRNQIVDAIWGMLGGVVFYFRSDESFEDIAEETKRLILSAVFGSK